MLSDLGSSSLAPSANTLIVASENTSIIAVTIDSTFLKYMENPPYIYKKFQIFSIYVVDG